MLLGNGDGSSAAPATFSAAGDSPNAVALADFNGDGNLDVAVATNGFSSHAVGILLGNGNGTFGPETTVAAAGFPTFMAVGDFNDDNASNLAVAGDSPRGPSASS